MKRTHRFLLCLLSLIIALLLLTGLVVAAAPSLPHTFYGTLTLDGGNAPAGLPLTATISNTIYATATTFLNPNGDTAYQIHMPGDDPDTPGREGATTNDTITFFLDGNPAIQTGTWTSGNHTRLDLTTFSGPQAPLASFLLTPTVAFIGETVTFTNTSSDVDSMIAAWGWAFGDGATSTTQHPTHAYTTFGIFTATLTVTDTDSLTATAQQTVRVMALPTADFTLTPADPRAGENIQFNDLSSDPDGTITDWLWDFDGLGSSTEQNPQFTFTTTGDYFVTLTVTDNDGNTNFLTQQIHVGTPARADFSWSPDPALVNQPVQFTDQSTSTAGTITAWSWGFGDGQTSTLQNPSHTYSNTLGLFIVTLTVTDSVGYTDTLSVNLLVTTPPVASFTHTPTTPGNGQLVQFSDTSTHPDPTATLTGWLWEFGDGATSSLQNPSHAFSTGRYTITLTITDSNGLTDTTTAPLIANDPPLADPGGPYTANEGDSVALNAAGSSDPDGTLTAFAWELDGNGQFDDASGISALTTYDDDGLFPVVLQVTDNLSATGVATTTATIANVAPAVSAGTDLTVTISQTVSLPPATFFDPGLADTHTFTTTWGDGGQDSGAIGHINGTGTITGSNVYFVSGVYTVTVCVSDDDSGTDCDGFRVTVLLPDLLTANKSVGLLSDADGSGNASPGDTLRYTVTVTNSGSINAVNAIFSDTLDVNVSPVPGSVSTTQGTILDGNDAGDSRILIDLGVIPPAGTATITFDITINTPLPSGTTNITNTATLWGSNFHTVTTNQTTTPVFATPDLTLTTTDLRDTAQPGQLLVYSLWITNTGNQAATGIIVTGTLPANTTFAGADYSGLLVGNVVSWTIPSLPGGASLSRAMVVEVDTPLPAGTTTLTHTATVRDDGLNGADPTPNNSDTDINTVNLDPDLVATGVDPAGTTTNPQTLQLSGTTTVTLQNSGSLAVTTPFSLTLFEDSDRDGLYSAGVDNVLGSELVTSVVNPAGTLTIPLTLSSTVAFRDVPIHAFVDSTNLITELSETNNVADSSDMCQIVPPVGDMNATVELSWPLAGQTIPFPDSVNSFSTPLVAQLTDDNGDGQIDPADTPDIIFVSFAWRFSCGEDSCNWFDQAYVLRAIQGDTGELIFSVQQPGFTYARSGLSAGDIDGDGIVEIITTNLTTNSANRLLAYEHDGTVKWTSDSFYANLANDGTDRTNPLIADLEGDGTPEIIAGANVINADDGSLRWSGSEGQAWQAINNYPPGALFADRSGAVSTVADLNLDGILEVVTGQTAYRADGSIYWHLDDLDDGYPAIGNFDGDAFPEIVVASRGTVRLHEHTGELIWGPIDMPGSNPEPGGPPTIADLDGDGQPEIALAGSSQFVAYEGDGTLLWQSPSQDASSAMTGSTVFDLDGDGDYEVIYRDEQYLRIYQGSDGAILYQLELSSATVNEMPVVADVDNDGHAEIIASSDQLRNRDGTFIRTNGIRVIGNGNWVASPSIWNQHAFYGTNVNPDGTIPSEADWFWLTHNTYRTNLDPDYSPFSAPDATLSYLRVDLSAFPDTAFVVRVGNGGAAPLPAGLPVAFYDGDPAGTGTLLGTATTSTALLPGMYEDVTFVWDNVPTGTGEVWAVVDDADAHSECREDNNSHSLTYDVAELGLAVDIDDGLTALNAGDVTTYTLTLVNARPVTATNTFYTATLPSDTFFLSASDGGIESGGVITWPSVDMPPNSVLTRTFLAQVDPVIPLSVKFITATATIDGGTVDPSPWNNNSSDTDQVLTVAAQAGGPYTANEGATILLDGSGSSDRDGTVVLYEWDLDGDGLFDEATGITTTLSYTDDLSIFIGLRVTDDSGEQDVDYDRLTFLNVPAVVIAGTDVMTFEGSLVSLPPAVFSDTGTADTHTAFVDWGDGAVISATVVEAGGSGTVLAGHAYGDDGAYTATVCVTDDDGGVGCDSFGVTIDNAPPDVALGEVDLNTWMPEDLNANGSSDWDVLSPTRVDQRVNNGPTFFYGPYPAYGNRLTMQMRAPNDGDNDFFGIVLGFRPGDGTNPNADYLLIDWKRDNQNFNFGSCGSQFGARGLAVTRVRGVPVNGELWSHQTLDCNPTDHSVEELARGFTLGNTLWARNRDYDFTVEYDDSQLRVWVDGVLQFDLRGDFPAGRIGFYNYSQGGVQYKGVGLSELAGVEGSVLNLTAPFGDPGILDTHTAEVDWGDGTVVPAEVLEVDGSGVLSSTHIYQDNGAFSVQACATDDDGGVGCNVITATVSNVPPIVDAGPDREVLLGDTFTPTLPLLFDPGALDVHTATISWGDGITETGVVSYTASSIRGITGTVLFPTHTYTDTGVYTATVCLTDDDGGRGCDPVQVNVTTILVDVGEDQLAVEGGDLTFTGVFTDPLASSAYTYTWDMGDGTVLLTDSLTVTHTFVEDGVYLVTLTVANDSGLTGLGRTFALVVNLAPTVEAGAPVTITEGMTVTLEPATFSDAGVLDTHTASIAWGDGVTTTGTVIETDGSGTVDAAHRFLDDGVYAVQVCVTDDELDTGCDTLEVTVLNAPPITNLPLYDINTWVQVNHNGTVPNWSIASDGRSVRQFANNGPSMLLDPESHRGVRLTGRVTPGSDNDLWGLVFGIRPGDEANPNANYLLVDWKDTTQSSSGPCGSGSAVRGLALSRVTGTPLAAEFWFHANRDCTPAESGLELISRGLTRGNSGYGGSHVFVVDYLPGRLTVWVDGVLEFDYVGDVPAGNIGFYTYAQPTVTFWDFTITNLVADEGSPVDVYAPFSDVGLLDTHTGTVDWGGAILPGVISPTIGGGVMTATYTYLDDANVLVLPSVVDDDGGIGSRPVTVTVNNVAPTVTASPTQTVNLNTPFTLQLATYSDPGTLDTHTTTIAWGDGSFIAQPVAVANVVTGTHTYTATGTYSVTVTVVDDDGGTGVDILWITVEDSPTAITLRRVEVSSVFDWWWVGVILAGGLLITSYLSTIPEKPKFNLF